MRTRLLTLSCALGLLGFGCAADATGDRFGCANPFHNSRRIHGLAPSQCAPQLLMSHQIQIATQGTGRSSIHLDTQPGVRIGCAAHTSGTLTSAPRKI